jgi:hypothetical protein
MLTLWAGALQFLVNFCKLFPAMAIDTNSILPTTQNLACRCRHSSRADWNGGGYVKAEARSNQPPVCLLPAATTGRYWTSISSKRGCLSRDPLESWVERAAACQGSTSRRASTDKTLKIISSISQTDANRKASYWDQDEKVQSFHIPTLDGEYALLANVPESLQLSGIPAS